VNDNGIPAMKSDEFSSRLSDYLDGEDMAAGEIAAIEAHLATCDSCRTTLAELRAVVSRAGSLTDTPPAIDAWDGIAARLAPAAALPFARPRLRRFSFTLPQLVAAGLALMVLSGGLVWVSRLGDPRASLPPAAAQAEFDDAETLLVPATFADASYDEAVADLEKVLAAGRGRLDAETVRILEDNLQTIDQAIEQSRKALRGDPANVYLNNHFAASRNRKLALLRRASALAMAQDAAGGS
jgi:anti-sigma factor RsiW